ncbi:DUF7289 family protein [Halomarina litorea]|uniref:DUF7289 family protein n=1 Tax=Halomarina litorea TaxID=2961595 RepID=UPI0020C23571|nr:hypothetical protein [Halomarina sp. BCD28]
MDSRGVSDVVAFVLVFSLIAATTGVVYAVGFTGLESARNAERVDNAERAFEVLGDNMADIYREGAPSRKTEIKLADAGLSFGETTSMNVSIENDTDEAGEQIYYEANLQPVVFSAAGTDLVYEGGAVVRSADGYARMVTKPPLLFSDQVVVLSYVVTSNTGQSSVTGDATALVRGVRTGQALLVQNNSNPKMTLRIETTTPRAAMWERYINDRVTWAGADWTPADPLCTTTYLGGGRSEVVCTVKSDSLYLTSTGIDVELTV